MIPFSLEIPTRVYFGRYGLAKALKEERAILGERVLIVTTGGSLKRLGYLDELKDVLKDLSDYVYIYDKVSPNPELSAVDEAVKIGRSMEATSVIGFGGGSSIDAGKAVACGLACKKSIGEYYYNGLEPEASVPMIAIPTTAGSGSELSKGAIISDEKTMQKKGLRGYSLYPKVAIVDSHFTEQIPYKVTMETGFDVFAHAMESFVSNKSNSFSEILSLEAIRIVGENLLKLAENLAETHAREKMSYASMIMGVNLGNVGTALPHRLQYPVGIATGTSHGAGLLALYPAWLKYEYKYSSEKIDQVAYALCGKECHGESMSLGEILLFINKLNVRNSLCELGITEAILDTLENKVSGNMQNDPAFIEEDIITQVYRQTYQI